VLGEEVIRFVQELELLRIASTPFAEAAVKAKPEPRAKRQWTVAPFRRKPCDLPAVWRHAPHQIRKLGGDPVGRFVIVSRKGHLTAESALLVKPYTPFGDEQIFVSALFATLNQMTTFGGV
jgi:hypothetical protein